MQVPLHITCMAEAHLAAIQGLTVLFWRSQHIQKGHGQLIRFAPHVQTLYGSLLDVRLDDRFSQGHLSNLKELSLFCKCG